MHQDSSHPGSRAKGWWVDSGADAVAVPREIDDLGRETRQECRRCRGAVAQVEAVAVHINVVAEESKIDGTCSCLGVVCRPLVEAVGGEDAEDLVVCGRIRDSVHVPPIGCSGEYEYTRRVCPCDRLADDCVVFHKARRDAYNVDLRPYRPTDRLRKF